MMADKKPLKSKVLLDVHIPGKWILGVLVALGVLFVAAVIGFSAVNRIDTCETCHIIKPEVATYKQSAHYRAGVGCQKCHTKPGVFNYFIRNIQGVTNLILYVSDTYQRPITTFVGADNCTQCHPNAQIEKDLVVGDIRVNHTGLRQDGYQCLTCHANISHPGTRPAVARTSQNKMSICARCHDGKKLPDDCDICHVGGVPADAPKVKMPLHMTPGQCTECHQQKIFCAKCHNGLQMPHPEHWTKEHGAVVVDRGKSICASCHLKEDPKFCIDCHGLADAASGRLADEPRRLRAHGRQPEEVRQVPRRGQLHQVPRPADAAPVRLDVAALERRARQPEPLQQVPQQLVLHRLPRRRAAAQRRLHRRPSEPHVQPGQRLHEVPRQRRHGPPGLLRWPVPQRFDQLKPAGG